MQKKRNQRSTLTTLIISISLVSGSNLYADGFYTIIGPDGRPMIVPKKEELKVQTQPKQEKVTRDTLSINLPKKEETAEKKGSVIIVAQPILDKVAQPSKENEIIHTQIAPIKKTQRSEVIDNTLDQSENSTMRGNTQKKKNELRIDKKTVSNTETKKLIDSSKVLSESNDSREPFTDIDGVKYVNNEFLEDQEFNLDGKKRFYTMPDGSGRFETIERKKGVSRSMLDRIMNRSLEKNQPITLAESYIRLSAQDLAFAFENDKCFIQEYAKTIKKLTPKNEVGVWPKKPLKEKFEYELVELDSSIRYVQMDSFASSIEKPVYYWPLVVFLDEKGCINEGVSGFKNNSVNTSLFKHAAIQGTLRVPSNSRYLMMTPLASAVDVPEKELSNQGQINLSVLQ